MKENLESTNKGAGESTKVQEEKKKVNQFMLSHTKLQEEIGFKKNYRHFL